MKKIFIPLVLLTLATLALSGCQQKEDTNNGTNKQSTTQETQNAQDSSAILEKISSEDAKEMMDQSQELIILDVRTEAEYASGHIEGAILIPDYELAEKAEEILTDKSTPLLVYCRSGNRSGKASTTLQKLGYTNIYDFGGIIDWPYDIVTN